MSSSDDDYDFSGNHMAGKANFPNYKEPNYNQDNIEIEDLDLDNNNFQPKMNDLKLEDNWNYDPPNPTKQQPVKSKSKRQELLEAQKNKLSKKKRLVGENERGSTQSYSYKKSKASSDNYDLEYQPEVNKFDQELAGKTEHESVKKNLQDHLENHRMEYIAEDPAMILNKNHFSSNINEELGKVGTVNIEEAKYDIGQYDESKKNKRKKKKKRRQANEEDPTNGEDDQPDHESQEPDYFEEKQQVVKNYKEELPEEVIPDTRPHQSYEREEGEGEGDYKRKNKKKKKKARKTKTENFDLEEDKRQIDQEMGHLEEPEKYFDPEDREDADETQIHALKEEKIKRSRTTKSEKKEMSKRKKEEILKIKNEFMEKLISPFTDVDELVNMFMRPIPKEVGILECTIVRNKSGFNYWNPKYKLVLSDGERFLLNGKKRGGNKTSNYLVTLDQDNLKKKGQGYLGKLRANFMGTEFIVYDQGENPKKTKDINKIRREMASVLYESNVLGSKGPRKMRVIIPAIDKEDNI
jgi:hypothetical protein